MVGFGTSRRARATRAVVATLVALGLVGAACSSADGDAAPASSGDTTPAAGGASSSFLIGPADAPGPPRQGGSLVFGVEAEPDGLDPTRSAFDVSGNLMASAVFDPLAEIDDDGRAVPYLAEAITPDEDFTTWTITLRPDVTFHDGTPVDAEAVRLNVEYWLASFITAPSLAPVSAYEVTGPLELTLEMSQPWVTFPYAVTSQTGYIAAPSFLTNPAADGPPMAPVGSGPFRLDPRGGYTAGSSFSVVRFDDYWQDGLPHLDAIRFDFLPDPLRRVQELLDGDIDLLHGYTPSVLDRVLPAAEAGELKVVENGEGEEDVIALNTARPPFDDPVARRALAHATDASAWRAEAEATTEDRPVRGPFVEGQLGFSEDDGYLGYDPELARQLVEEYEATHGQPLTTEVLSTTLVTDQALTQILVDQWAAVGIEATITTMPLAELVVTTVLGEYQLVNWRNFGSPDPDGDYLWWHSSGVLESPRISTNVARYGNDEIDAALDLARGSTDPVARDEAYQEVVRLLNDGAAYVWLGRPTWVLAARPRVQGLAASHETLATLGAKTWLAELWVDG